MMRVYAPFLIACIAGIAVALQGQVMGVANRVAGTASTAFLTYGVGGIVSALIWAIRREPTHVLRSVPWYGWSAGVLGLLIVGGISYAAPRLGLSRTLVITVGAQLGAALLIESFGMFGTAPRSIDASKVAGVLLTIGGVWLVVK